MKPPETVTFLTEAGLRDSAAAGQHNFLGMVQRALESGGYRVAFSTFDAPPAPGERTLSHIRHPRDAQGLVFRRAYHYPFWQIEVSAHRAAWDVSFANFDGLRNPAADSFYERWRKRLFAELPDQATRDGFIYVALQGKLLDHRSFRRCTPIDMLYHCLRYGGGRPVLAALHPKERYTRAELATLDALARENANLTIRTGGMEDALSRCEFVVTQTSAVAFNAFFFEKPALLFGDTDFHHICVAADMAALGKGFEEVAGHRPDYAGYLYWFWQENCINAGRDTAEARITDRFRRFGWLK